MRVTGGIYKGRIIKTIPGLSTRPTTDKIRQSIFNILMNDIVDTSVLDIFAGSGALGIEALSRGAGAVIFIESGHKQVEIIRGNLKMLDLKAEIMESDYSEVCCNLQKIGKKFNLIFADPPYEKIKPPEVIKTILQYNLLKDDGLFIIEHKSGQIAKSDRVDLLKKRKFGQTEVSFYVKKRE
jgi:16S rRNA (guanine966-N2)-methyltransferase